MGHVVERVPGGRWETVRFSVPARLARYVAEKGSVAVDGVSLTVIEVDDCDEALDPSFTVGLIPTTLAATTLGLTVQGTTVNLEVDVIAKWCRAPDPPRGSSVARRARRLAGRHELAARAIPSNGVRLQRRARLARDASGRPVLWVERSAHPITGPPVSHLRFDVLAEDPPET